MTTNPLLRLTRRAHFSGRYWGQSGHASFALQMSACDPKRTSVPLPIPRFEAVDAASLTFGGGNAAARFHIASQRRGSHLAAGCVCAAGRKPTTQGIFLGSPAGGVADIFSYYDSFRAGLSDVGYVEGSNIILVAPWRKGYSERCQVSSMSCCAKTSPLLSRRGQQSVLCEKELNHSGRLRF